MPGRTFYDDDDPFFQAVDLWYGVTMDKEVHSQPFSRLHSTDFESGTIRTQ